MIEFCRKNLCPTSQQAFGQNAGARTNFQNSVTRSKFTVQDRQSLGIHHEMLAKTPLRSATGGGKICTDFVPKRGMGWDFGHEE
jgi:hypothetical protein